MLSRIFLNATYINFIHGQLFPSSSAVISLRQLTKFAIIRTQPLSDADDFSNEQSLYGCLGSSIYAGPNLAITHKYHQTNSERCFIAFSFSVSLLEYWILRSRDLFAHTNRLLYFAIKRVVSSSALQKAKRYTRRTWSVTSWEKQRRIVANGANPSHVLPGANRIAVPFACGTVWVLSVSDRWFPFKDIESSMVLLQDLVSSW